MREVQTGSSGKAKSDRVDYPAEAKEQRRTFGDIFFAPDKLLLANMLRAIGDPPVQLLLWNGQTISNHNGNEVARVLIHDRGALLKLVADAELYFGEMYSARRIEIQGNLLDFLEAVYRAFPLQSQGRIGKKLLSTFYDARRNTLNGSRRNIHHHYDIGNDFYRLWLDERMLYTCAYFPEPGTSLEDAQLAKMDHVCRKLRLQPGDQVVEAGCGWGALALHMAKHYGVKVTAYNISSEQIIYARQRAQAEGLDGQVEFIEDDYRNVLGKFDVVRLGRHARTCGDRSLSGVGVGHQPRPQEYRAGLDPQHRPEFPAPDGRMDRAAHLSRCIPAQSGADDGYLRAFRPLGSGCGKFAAALCQDPGALVAAL